ncbi:hypothetical protein ACFO9Q_01865 [Paenibacillus sp. GCM10023252]|uniref:hypothetical protein n=1 Tax=Paenibacillus sp. GCM10023252 TaxID=3252649 RepID=UPI00361554DD
MRMLLFVMWLLFISYAWLLAPGASGSQDPILQDLLRMKAEEPAVLVMFSLLGVFPMVYACLLLRDDRLRIPAWPFVLLSFALGAFALLPYYFLLSGLASRSEGNRTPIFLLRITDSRLFVSLLFLITSALMIYAITGGDGEAYAAAFRHSSFVHVMTIDFVLLTLLSVYAIYTNNRLSKRGGALLGLIPILGPLIYLWITAGTRQGKIA